MITLWQLLIIAPFISISSLDLRGWKGTSSTAFICFPRHQYSHVSRVNSDVSISCTSTASSSLWRNSTVSELKYQLKQRNLPASGVKAELIERLIVYDVSSSGKSKPKPISSQSTTTTIRKGLFTPPKDETEIHVVRKEVHETVRMLEGLKLTAHSHETKVKQIPPSMEETMQQRQQRKIIQTFQQSLQPQLTPNSNDQVQSTTKTEKISSPQQYAVSKEIQRYVEQFRLRSANDLKEELASFRLSIKGRKSDLVTRLAAYYVSQEIDNVKDDDKSDFSTAPSPKSTPLSAIDKNTSFSFAGIPRLSSTAANALYQAFAKSETTADLHKPEPTPIQAVAIPKLFYPPHPSAILHAPTGSGKTLAYLLPITETLWNEVENPRGRVDASELENGMSLILLPTRELAAQVAGVATALAPRGMVRLIPHPMDLMRCWKDEGDAASDFAYYEEHDDEDNEIYSSKLKYSPRILVGSAKSISISLFGDGKMPGSPTRKPDGKRLLSCLKWLVMDEVDRLLNINVSRIEKANKQHEKPAALLAAAAARLTLGRVQVIAVSATVGRPLRRELSRVLGLHSSECPETLRGKEDSARMESKLHSTHDDKHLGRAVTIPDTVRNYVLPVDGSTTGSLITSAAFAAKAMFRSANVEESNRKILLVLTRNCDIKIHNAIGALHHFGVRPEPQSLLDVLDADGTDRLIQVHRRVSRVVGVGGSRPLITNTSKGYFLVTHEDNVRGLHLDGLDAVIVIGRPGSPDEYTHIAGRTGRAGRRGSVLNIVSFEQASALSSWSKMLGVDFLPLDESEVADIVGV